MEAQAPVRGHEWEPCKSGGRAASLCPTHSRGAARGPGVFWGEGDCNLHLPILPDSCHSTRSLPAAPGTPGAPAPQVLLQTPTHDVQVLPHHALGVGAQEDVEVQNPARCAPRQGRARLQDHVWGRREHRRSEVRIGPRSSPVPRCLHSTHPWRCCSAGRHRGPSRRPLSPGRRGGSRTG